MRLAQLYGLIETLEVLTNADSEIEGRKNHKALVSTVEYELVAAVG
jgi:hypothetical protein